VDDAPVLRIEFLGGLRPAEYYLLHTPTLLVYADGTVIHPAFVTAIYPPVAITPFNVFTISQNAVADLIERATAAGLDEAQSIHNPDLFDAGSGFITLKVDGALVTSEIYGLDYTENPPADWDAETTERFNAIQAVADYARSMATSLDAADIIKPESPYTPERLELFAFVPDPAKPLPSGVPDLTAAPLTWPLDRSLEDIGAVYDRAQDFGADLPEVRCTEIGGDDASAVIAVAATGNFISPWKDDGQLYGLLINPLFPGDSGCRS
jgi:hypothetical protein